MQTNSIRILPSELSQKIAAGEIVERPSSVIKELIENSLDAHATHIHIEIEDGGKKRITVMDDGDGIPYDEVPIALERHATSKIQKLDDLWNIQTMGFRGEALPSIATISRFTLETKMSEQRGRKLYLEGAALLHDEPKTNKEGTRITVEDLFFNVPARLKFLRTKSSEVGSIRELIERIALCHPKVSFTLLSEGKKILEVASAQDQEKRVADILETSLDEIEKVESQFETICIRGWLDRSHRATNSRNLYLSVNGRMVRDKLLHQAVVSGLKPRMMEGEYPKIYLSVMLPASEVDVNVHPAKTEVRFRRSKDVFQVIHAALNQLAQKSPKAFYSVPEFSRDDTTTSWMRSSNVSLQPAILSKKPEFAVPQPMLFSPPASLYKTKPDLGDQTPKETPITSTPGFQHLQYIGQLKNTYLLFQDDGGLILIDQHAAHERIRYEQIKKEFLNSGLKPQPLLLSVTVKCPLEQTDVAQQRTSDFLKLGFEVEIFGEDSVILRSTPEGVEQTQVISLFKTLLNEMTNDEPLVLNDPSRLSPKLERLLSTTACHSSIRAGQALSSKEVFALVEQMEKTASSLNCPHGRPASIRLHFHQIENLFKR